MQARTDSYLGCGRRTAKGRGLESSTGVRNARRAFRGRRYRVLEASTRSMLSRACPQRRPFLQVAGSMRTCRTPSCAAALPSLARTIAASSGSPGRTTSLSAPLDEVMTRRKGRLGTHRDAALEFALRIRRRRLPFERRRRHQHGAVGERRNDDRFDAQRNAVAGIDAPELRIAAALCGARARRARRCSSRRARPPEHRAARRRRSRAAHRRSRVVRRQRERDAFARTHVVRGLGAQRGAIVAEVGCGHNRKRSGLERERRRLLRRDLREQRFACRRRAASDTNAIGERRGSVGGKRPHDDRRIRSIERDPSSRSISRPLMRAEPAT